ncbi:MAG: 2-dehydropantoate 2-reductase [Aeropyrum sp.]|nr:2-dehydropantoate 2-reductase [Aeropyrum sp.]
MNSYCILGLGAVGSIIGLHVFRATGQPPIAVIRSGSLYPARVFLEGVITASYPIQPYRGRPPNTCRLTIVATKAYDAPSAVEKASSWSEMVAVAGNGWGGYERAVELGLNAAAIVTDYGAARLAPRLVRVTGRGGFVVGSRGRPSNAAVEAHLVLSRGGARSILAWDIEGWRWLKASANAGINPVTALLGVRNGFILEDSDAWRLASRAALEVEEVAKALGVELPLGAVSYLRSVALATYDNLSSTLQDLEACRRVEAEEILGYVVESGARAGVRPATVEALYRLLKSAWRARCRASRSRIKSAGLQHSRLG